MTLTTGTREDPPLVARDAELETILAALAGRGQALVGVSGEPGIGKTRLLAEVAARSEDDGALTLVGRASEFERDLPFALWIDALDDYVRSLGDATLARVADVAPELAAVLPGLRPLAGDVPDAAPPVGERHRVHAAVRRLLEALAVEHPVVVALDDLHWADDASVELVAALLRRPPASDGGLVLAMRPGQTGARLAAAIERAARDGGLLRVQLAPLDRAASDRLLGDGLAPAVRATLYDESGGNPFLLQQLARAAPTRRGAVPQGVVEAIAEELRALTGDAEVVLQAAAVVGDPFEPALVAAAAERDDADVSRCLDLLAEHELIRPTDVPQRFAMRHPLIRRAVYESAGATWRLGAHARVAAALEARGAAAELRAHHVARSAQPGDEAAVAVLRDAADTVIAHAPAAAATWLQAALVLTEGRAEGQEARIELLVALSAALAASARIDEAADTLGRALDQLPGDHPRRVELVATCAHLEHRVGRHRDARDRLRAALAERPDTRSADHLSLLVELAADAFFQVDPDGMRAWAADALAAARAAGDRPHAFAASAALALAGVIGGRMDEARRDATVAAAAYEDLSDAELAARLDGAQFLGLAEMYVERFDEMRRHADRALRVARAARRDDMLGVLAIASGFGAAIVGEPHEAVRVLDGAVETTRLIGSPFELSWVLGNQCYAATFAGDTALGLATGEESLELARQLDDSVVGRAYPASALADALLIAGNTERAREVLLDGAGGPEISLITGFWRCYGLDQLVQAEIVLGRPDAARAAAACSRAHADAIASGLARGWSDRSHALLELDAGNADGAARLALDAHRALLAGGARIEAARAQIIAGRALGRAGRRDEALEQLRAAFEALERCGSAAFRDEAARELRHLGHRPARGVRDATGIEALSGRERQVAELIRQGRTNPEIARELYLSKKTVETHVRNVFAKLRVSSRIEVAQVIARESPDR